MVVGCYLSLVKNLLNQFFVVSLGFSAVTQAEIIARFDVGSSGNNAQDQEGSVQDGWADVNLSNAATGVTQNGVTLILGEGANESRNRTGPFIADHPLELVFRDFIFTRDDDGEVPVTFSGLRPNTDYEIITYAYDSSGVTIQVLKKV